MNRRPADRLSAVAFSDRYTRTVKSSVEALEGNKVKVVVEVEEAEFEKDLDAAFSRLAEEVRLPGFRPGKVPRKVLEARIGQGHAREEAFRASLPNYYSEAVLEHEVDVIAPPEIDITAGQEDGDVAFDAVVEVRPSVEVTGYEGLEVEIERIDVNEDDITEAVDRMRGQFSELQPVDRAAEAGDHVTINIAATHAGEEIPGMTTDGYDYEVGSGATGIDEFDENLTGASTGDELSFSAEHPDPDEGEDESIEFSITVTDVQERVLPEPTNEWVSENSEFDDLEGLQADYRSKMEESRLSQAVVMRRNKVAEAVSDLVEDDAVPAAMIDSETENRVQDMALRLQAQGMSFEQFLQFSGQSQDDFITEVRAQAANSAKLDLALRSIAITERIDVTDAEFNDELEKVSVHLEKPVEEVRAELTEHGQLPAVRSDLLKTKTLDWLIERTTVIDEDGKTIPADALQLPDEPTDEEAESGGGSEEDSK